MRSDLLLAFLAAWGALVILPGPDTALVVARTVGSGRGSGTVAAVGSLTALAAHVVFAAVGLSAIIAQSAAAFTVLKLAGAAYLVVLGLRLLLTRAPSDETEAVAATRAPLSARDGYRQAVLTGLLNPKSALFFLTFLPQFVDPASPAAPQFAVLGLITLAVAAAWHATLIALAVQFRAAVARPRARVLFERLTGSVFVVLGSKLATASR